MHFGDKGSVLRHFGKLIVDVMETQAKPLIHFFNLCLQRIADAAKKLHFHHVMLAKAQQRKHFWNYQTKYLITKASAAAFRKQQT